MKGQIELVAAKGRGRGYALCPLRSEIVFVNGFGNVGGEFSELLEDGTIVVDLRKLPEGSNLLVIKAK